MAEVNIEPEPLPEYDDGRTELSNVKKVSVGNGRWLQDSLGLKLYDDDGNVVIFIGFEE